MKLIDGVREDGESWAPVADSQNDWVQVGKDGECNLYSNSEKEKPAWGTTGENNEEITRHIMCCDGAGGGDDAGDSESSPSQPPPSAMTEWEQQIQDAHRPSWFSDRLGWEGTTHEDAKAFCESIPRGSGGDTLHLCPLQAYCPNGPRDAKPLFLQMDAFEGEQWAPLSNGENAWVMVGTLNRDPSSTCRSYMELHHKQPSWGLDGSRTELKKHLLCCESDGVDGGGGYPADPLQDDGGADASQGDLAGVDVPETGNSTPVGSEGFASSIVNTFHPMWYDSDQGWNGGSHDDAIHFCQQKEGFHGKSMELCPYAAYCPNGPSKPPLGGQIAYFEKEGLQWAPIFGQENHWVLIGRKGTNSATTCLSHEQLEGVAAPWGLDGSMKEVKKHIMCCSPLQ